MKKSILIIISVAITVVFFVIGYSRTKKAENLGIEKRETIYTATQIKHGEYLVNTMGCDDCHSTKIIGPKGVEIDLSRRLSGHPESSVLPKVDKAELNSWVLFAHTGTAAVGPWGASFSANLTSDATGIGSWTFNQFKTALQKGKYKGLENGRDLLPPMPWQQYRHLTEDDMRDIFAFLKSTKPVKNLVPAPVAARDLN